MDRHLEYRYKIGQLDSENLWIYIQDMNDSGWEKEIFDPWSDKKDDGPVEFLLRIKEKNDWHLKQVDDYGYQFMEDNLNMIFQWDDLFGFTIQIIDWNVVEEVLLFLESYVE